MKSVSRNIYFLLFVGILLKLVETYYHQNNIDYNADVKGADWPGKVSFIGNVLITFAAILSFLTYKKYFPQYIIVCYLLMILLVTLTSLRDFEAIAKKPSIFYSVKGIGTYLNFGILFFTAGGIYYSKILKLFYYLCFVFIIAGIINLGKLGFGASRDDQLDAILYFSLYLIWVFPFFLLQQEDNKKKNIINLLTFLIIFMFVLSTGSRSYMIIYLIFFYVKFKSQLKSKNGLLIICGAFLFIGISVLLFSNSELGKVLTGAFNIFSERTNEDSRSSQLLDFLDQYNTDYLFQGVGPSGLWYWTQIGEYYYYLDNQFLLLAWWAGLPAMLVYLFYLIGPLSNKAEILIFEDVKGLKLIIFLWILACAGFAIYVGINSELYYNFLTLIIGMQTCKYTQIKVNDIENQV